MIVYNAAEYTSKLQKWTLPVQYSQFVVVTARPYPEIFFEGGVPKHVYRNFIEFMFIYLAKNKTH